MSDDKPSIAELQRETERWPTRWRPALGEEGEWQGFWWGDTKEGEDRVSADTDEDYANDFAARVASLANAAPVLLEIAAAGKLMRGPCDHPEGRCANGSHFRGCSRFEGEKRFDAALAKVRQ